MRKEGSLSGDKWGTERPSPTVRPSGDRAPEVPGEHGWDGWVSGTCQGQDLFSGPWQEYHQAAQDLGRFERSYRPLSRASQAAQWGKKSACQCRRPGSDPWVGKIPWRRIWQLTPVFLPGECHGRGAWRATVHRITKNRTRLSTHTWASIHEDTEPSGVVRVRGQVIVLKGLVGRAPRTAARAGEAEADECPTLLSGLLGAD